MQREEDFLSYQGFDKLQVNEILRSISNRTQILNTAYVVLIELSSNKASFSFLFIVMMTEVLIVFCEVLQRDFVEKEI